MSKNLRVKALDWMDSEQGGFLAHNEVTGNYQVMEFSGEWIAVGLGPYPSEQMAKDACFQRHERAIRSQIEP